MLRKYNVRKHKQITLHNSGNLRMPQYDVFLSVQAQELSVLQDDECSARCQEPKPPAENYSVNALTS